MGRKKNLKKTDDETIRQVTGFIFISIVALAITLPVSLIPESAHSAYFVGAVAGSTATIFALGLLGYFEE